MKKYVYFLMLFSGMFSCYDANLVDQGKGSSVLSIKVFGDNHTPVINAYINISISGMQIVNDSTNSNGELAVRLLEGEYYISARIKENGVYFSSSDGLQMVGGYDRTREYEPKKNVGRINFRLVDLNSAPIEGWNVVLLRKIFQNGNYTLNDYLKEKYVSAVTNAKGEVIFENIPNGFSFGVLYYLDDTKFKSPSSYAFSTSNGPDYYQVIKY